MYFPHPHCEYSDSIRWKSSQRKKRNEVNIYGGENVSKEKLRSK